jgi:hypothetical protein
VRVNHGRSDILVAKQFLDRADIVAIGKQVRGEGVTERELPTPFPVGVGILTGQRVREFHSSAHHSMVRASTHPTWLPGCNSTVSGSCKADFAQNSDGLVLFLEKSEETVQPVQFNCR